MPRNGPDQSDIKARLIIGLIGLGLLGSAYAFDLIGGIGSLKIVALCAAFFGGSVLWSAWRLWTNREG